MVKQKKKRTKKYSGIDASSRGLSITRVTAVQRSTFGQWRHDNSRKLKIARTIIIIAIALAVIISGIISLF